MHKIAELARRAAAASIAPRRSRLVKPTGKDSKVMDVPHGNAQPPHRYGRKV